MYNPNAYYYYNNPSYFWGYHPYYHYRPTFPEVNTEQFQVSAGAFQPLMDDAHKIIHEFSESSEFARKVMSAAQQSQTAKIQTYMREIGIERPVEVIYNPDSIRLTLVNQANDIDCCKLSIALHW